MRKSYLQSIALVTVIALSASGMAVAEPLAPGKPAGVRQANLSDNGTVVAVGLMAVAIVIGVVASQNGAQGGYVGGVNPTASTFATSP